MKIDPSKYRREAQQAETLSDLESKTYDILDDDLVVASADTVIYEHYEDIQNAEIWLEQLHWEWLQVNMTLSQKTRQSTYYRYIVLPYPYVVTNTAKRAHLIDFIILNIHIHLWHGVICAVKFLDPRKHDLKSVTQEMNFFIVPRARMFFGLPSYYRSDTIEQVLVTGSEYDKQQSMVRNWISAADSDLVWLFYDEPHFEPTRLRGWHWTQLRRFFLQLHKNIRTCPLCRERRVTQLDHIGPISKGYYQTLPNLQLLCGPCNRHKSDIEISADPFAVRPFLSPHLQSKALNQTLQQPPPWLGYIRRPTPRVRSLAGKLDL